jgi:pimeloyl-ACP methyl ester carboxylesterase
MEEKFFVYQKQRLQFIITSPISPSDISLLMIHGAHRQLQNAHAFSNNIDILGQDFLSVSFSLLGHGDSVPGANTQVENERVSIEDQVEILNAYINLELKTKQLVIIGRSYGARIAMNLALTNLSRTLGVVFISPAGSQHYKKETELHSIPLLLVWSKDDPFIPFSETKIFEENSKKISTLYFDSLQKKGEEWRAHSAQSERPDEVNTAILNFIRQLRG